MSTVPAANFMNWSDRQKALAVGLIVFANFLQSISVGINAVVFPIALDKYGFSTSMIGVIMAVEYLSVFGISIYLPSIVRWLNVGTGLELSTLFRLPALLALGYTVSGEGWALWVFLHGVGNFLFGVLLQTWINSIPFDRARGFSMGLFGTSISLGLAMGPVVLSFAGSFNGALLPLQDSIDGLAAQWFGWLVPAQVDGYTRIGLVLSALISTISVLPIVIGRFLVPKFTITRKGSLARVVRQAPAAMFAVMLCGFSILGLQTFITVYGLRNGLELRDASFLMTAFMLGSISLEMPIAALSDWFDRRYVMIGLVLLSLIAAVYLPIAIYYKWSGWILLFLWGGMIGGLFSICLALTADRFHGEDLVTANGAFSLMDNLGGVFGILIIGLGMDLFLEDGLPYAIMLAAVAYFSFALTRYQVR